MAHCAASPASRTRGKWLLRASVASPPPAGRWTGAVDRAVMLISRDLGESWTATELPDSLGAVHKNHVAPLAGVMPAIYQDRSAQCPAQTDLGRPPRADGAGRVGRQRGNLSGAPAQGQRVGKSAVQRLGCRGKSGFRILRSCGTRRASCISLTPTSHARSVMFSAQGATKAAPRTCLPLEAQLHLKLRPVRGLSGPGANPWLRPQLSAWNSTRRFWSESGS